MSNKIINSIKANLLPKKKMIENVILFSVIFFIFFSFDLLTKYLFFSTEEYKIGFENNKRIIDWVIIGLRPKMHYGVTSGINNLIGFIGIHIFSWIVFFVIIISIFFVENKWMIAALALLNAGNMGNAFDRIFFQNGVRDLFFIPYHDRGTFNLADIFIVSGSVAIIIVYCMQFLIEFIRKVKSKRNISLNQNTENNLNEMLDDEKTSKNDLSNLEE
ncbi:signal peptidase II [Mycoplasma iguanae]|uniref:Signal peptidase II n=1 Tax=Mycoplasma iguanae TaxID=292461 RepID=A0ABY5R8D7_9MOLU|nr:signal peptidase II [Mycoplasma iguanae]UVD81541.1 signal peptidase II [Mycoplasma iguanae]